MAEKTDRAQKAPPTYEPPTFRGFVYSRLRHPEREAYDPDLLEAALEYWRTSEGYDDEDAAFNRDMCRWCERALWRRSFSDFDRHPTLRSLLRMFMREGMNRWQARRIYRAFFRDRDGCWWQKVHGDRDSGR